MATGYRWHLAADELVAPLPGGRGLHAAGPDRPAEPARPRAGLADDRPAGHQRQQQGAAEHGRRPGPTLGFLTIWYALVHNGATFRRDIVLAWDRSGREALEDDSLRPAGGKAQELRGEGRLVVSGLKPGESRFVRIRLASGKGREPDALVTVDEIVGGTGS